MDLSIVIPVYNSEKYIERCLESIIKHTDCEYEVICVDDGSADSSLKILQIYESTYENIHIFSQKHGFAGVARNTALKYCHGKYIHFLDSDDYIVEGAYNDLIKYALDIKSDYIKFKCNSFDHQTGEFIEKDYYSLNHIAEEHFNNRFSFFDYTDILYLSTAPWTGLCKRQFLNTNLIRFNNLECVNDRSFYVEVLTKSKSISLYDGFVVNHRINNRNSLVGIRTKRFNCQLSSYELIKKAVCNLPLKFRAQILSEEMRDLLFTYQRITDTSFDEELKKFLLTLDWSDINESIIYSKNMEKALLLLDLKPSDIIAKYKK